MDTRRLRAFLKIVETGSLTRAAAALNIAQPALSQQVAKLETHLQQKLLIRSHQGVTLTEAGRVLYRHAQLILRQVEQAESDVKQAAKTLSGYVSIGLAPYSAATTLSLGLLTAVRQHYPNVLLRIVEGSATTFSELIMAGRLDIGVMHDVGPMRGVKFQPLVVEQFFLVAPVELSLPGGPDSPVHISDLANVPLLLPSRINFVRHAVDAGFASLRLAPTIVGEVESINTLRDAVATGIGATILPWTVASEVVASPRSVMRAIQGPRIEGTVSICSSDQTPLSESATAVCNLLLELAVIVAQSGRWQSSPSRP